RFGQLRFARRDEAVAPACRPLIHEPCASLAAARALSALRPAGREGMLAVKELGMNRVWVLVAAFWVGLAGAAFAQQQRDPFNGQLGVIELALPPAEAARQAKLIGDALAGLEPQRPGQLDVYMITAALW